MTVIRQADFIQSIADAFQLISYAHPRDFIQAMAEAYRQETAPAAKDALAQLLANSRLSAENRRPICQDTGIAVVFVEVGMEVRWEADMSLQAMVDEGVRRAYTQPDNVLRASVLIEPAGARRNSGDNRPAVVHVKLVPGDQVEVKLAAKGGGSENKARFVCLNPSDSVVEWVVKTVETLGAGWCPPGILGIGIGGTPEKAMLLAKESLLAPLDLPQLRATGPTNALAAMRLEIADRVNALGIGAQGLGGNTTVLDVKILDYPTHAASLPVALIPNCAATRHAHFTLDGGGPAKLEPPNLEDWPEMDWQPDPEARRVDLDRLTREQTRQWRAGERLLLTGTLITARDAAHKRLLEYLAHHGGLPEGVDLDGKLIYYVGPVQAVKNEAVGPAGPTTATRMDKFTAELLRQTGVLGMIGKAERGPTALAPLREHQAVYLIAVGGAGYLAARAIKQARVIAFPELGMEAIHAFQVENFPVTVAVDAEGNNLHQTGPRAWRKAAQT